MRIREEGGWTRVDDDACQQTLARDKIGVLNDDKHERGRERTVGIMRGNACEGEIHPITFFFNYYNFRRVG